MSDELEALLSALQPLCAREIGPHAKRWDEQRKLDADLAPRLAEWGLIGTSVDVERGGAGAGMVGAAAIVETLAMYSGSVAMRVALHEAAAIGSALATRDDEALASAMSPSALCGWVGPARASQGPGGRGGLTMLAGGDADLVVARTSGQGIAMGRVAAASLSTRARESSGLRAAGWVDVLDPSALDVGGDDASEAAAVVAARVAVLIAATACGLARSAILEAAKYAMVREQFGSPLAAFQAIQWKVANAVTERDAAWALVTHAAGCLDRAPVGRCPTSAGDAAARAQLAAVRAAVGACSESLQIHGGYGYTEEFVVERLLRDSRACSAVDRNDLELRESLVPSLIARFA